MIKVQFPFSKSLGYKRQTQLQRIFWMLFQIPTFTTSYRQKMNPRNLKIQPLKILSRKFSFRRRTDSKRSNGGLRILPAGTHIKIRDKGLMLCFLLSIEPLPLLIHCPTFIPNPFSSAIHLRNRRIHRRRWCPKNLRLQKIQLRKIIPKKILLLPDSKIR